MPLKRLACCCQAWFCVSGRSGDPEDGCIPAKKRAVSSALADSAFAALSDETANKLAIARATLKIAFRAVGRKGMGTGPECHEQRSGRSSLAAASMDDAEETIPNERFRLLVGCLHLGTARVDAAGLWRMWRSKVQCFPPGFGLHPEKSANVGKERSCMQPWGSGMLGQHEPRRGRRKNSRPTSGDDVLE